MCCFEFSTFTYLQQLNSEDKRLWVGLKVIQVCVA